MGTLKVRASIQVSGPLADGTADRVLARWRENTLRRLSDEALDMLRSVKMDKSGRARGGFQENLHASAGSYTAVIKGPMIKGVVWAPWLEGTSKRNESTGFKGYRPFRKTRLKLQRRAPQVGQEELDKLMPELGGE